MVKHGWIEDDNMTFMLPHFEEYVYDKKNPGVEIKIIKNGKSNNKTKTKTKTTKRSRDTKNTNTLYWWFL